jgi:hypothetical protein
MNDSDWTAAMFLLFFDETEEERRARLRTGAPRPSRAAPPPSPLDRCPSLRTPYRSPYPPPPPPSAAPQFPTTPPQG